MVTQDPKMGRFSVEVELANYKDINLASEGHLAPGDIRRIRVRGVVDTGATRLVLPESVAAQLGVSDVGDVAVRYADGRTSQRRRVGGVHLTYLGRSSVFTAVLEPKRENALIGAIVMEELDLVADCTHQTLAPRDPKQIISEIE
ncbi:MAG: hypothetical protein C4547_15795 [Phycisphaerales bacterium]|nr:MAG: hypothetical protein C4547_15795 [Phycisphaerales bacterium]